MDDSNSSENAYDIGNRFPSQRPELALRSAESIAEMNELPVEFGIVTEEEGRSPSVTPSSPMVHSSRSTAAYNRLLRNDDRRHLISVESLAEINAHPSILEIRQPIIRVGSAVRTPTMNKRLRSASSNLDLRQLPSLTRTESLSSLQPRNSDYAYLPGTFSSSAEPSLTNSSYCYVAKNGGYKDFIVRQLPATTSRSFNPYAHVSRYRLTPSVSSSLSQSSVDSVETVSDWRRIPDVFILEQHPTGYFPNPVPPAERTLNKRAMGSQSEMDINRLCVTFDRKMIPTDECLNKRALSADSAYELSLLPPVVSVIDVGEHVFRDFSKQSLEDLRLLPSLSSYKLIVPDQMQPDATLLQQ